MSLLIRWAVVGCAGLSLAFAQVHNPNRVFQLDKLKTIKISSGGHAIHAYVMDTPEKEQEGMMFLTDKEVKPNDGFLFVFPTVQPGDSDHGFWMHNTLIPLDIIYISAGKKVINIREGKVKDDTGLPPAGAYLFVLELKQGTAKKIGIKPGSKFEIPPVHATG